METAGIILTGDDGEEVSFNILEQTELGRDTYLLVTESDKEDDEEAWALILREIPGDDETETMYETVEDENILKALSGVFKELLDDVDITIE
ncbi:MAG: DUF1292 domain-containing protein [Eubacterium sp.]|nr:DUF1292 domain-containing protein [Eubacterium sp.]